MEPAIRPDTSVISRSLIVNALLHSDRGASSPCILNGHAIQPVSGQQVKQKE